MDLGISGKWAIVCASSKGLGLGCAQALAQEGVNLVMNGRGEEALAAAVAQVRALAKGVEVKGVACDVTRPEGREQLLAAAPRVDILVNNAGGPPPGDFRKFNREDWLNAVEANMLTPIELIKATVDGMIDRGFGRVINITSSAVKAPIDILGLSNGARTGLTGFVAGLSRNPQLASRNVTINNLLPGRFMTDRLRSNFITQAKNAGKSEADMQEVSRQQIPAKRFGEAKEFGEACAYLCSAQAGYVTGQNFLIDGGLYTGTF
jgi:3-oxoacyl-[acyl-carrier protein] reductase